MGNLLPKKMGFFFSGKNPQFKFSKVVKGGAVVSFEPVGSRLPLAQRSPHAKMERLGQVCSEPYISSVTLFLRCV